MKRAKNLFEKVCSLENISRADAIAQKGKKDQKGVVKHNKNRERNLIAIRDLLVSKTFTTSRYSFFKIHDPKERSISSLPYFPDRIVHHAVMLQLEEILVSTFTADTYSCIKGRGIHLAARKLKDALQDSTSTTYCLKLDIKKFYPSVNNEILKQLLRKKIKDTDLLWLLDNIIDSTKGLPIGSYTSQYFANFYLTYFDHWIKEEKKVKYYFRYSDDMTILSDDKAFLHSLLHEIKDYLHTNLRLAIKDNYQIFPVDARGIDFLGYVFKHSHTLLRKSIKKSFARKMARGCSDQSKAAYEGWLKHCNGRNLMKTITDKAA
jgi:RNA-directed DNA polymerase